MSKVTKTETTARRASTADRSNWRGIFSGTSMYGFELLLATIGLFTVASVASYALFVLFNHWREASTSSAFTVPTGEFTLIIASSMIVWLPLALLFYLRTRTEQAARPIRSTSSLHKTLIGLFLVGVILTIASLCFVVVYALLRLAVGMEEDVVDILVRVVLPALLSAGLFTGLLFAYPRSARPALRTYTIGLIAAGLLPVLILLGVSFGQIRGDELDKQRASDLSTMQRKINQFVREKRELPGSLDDIDTSDLKRSVSEYRYEKQSDSSFGSTREYKLCATFSTNTKRSSAPLPSYTEDRPTSSAYANFRSHDRGQQCFLLRAATMTTSDYDDWFRRNLRDSVDDTDEIDA